ncbi:hypothetical protein MKW98_022998 [Papaver atlanticum]|uniref:Uncharacterized protein n=1 Tax=Papaver atlanticum TaxID=357466 RepID=A0AAD4TA80_9MAGN|nr:hypothetical protein MKW98_022998 [Papaver atlanticum]
MFDLKPFSSILTQTILLQPFCFSSLLFVWSFWKTNNQPRLDFSNFFRWCPLRSFKIINPVSQKDMGVATPRKSTWFQQMSSRVVKTKQEREIS